MSRRTRHASLLTALLLGASSLAPAQRIDIKLDPALASSAITGRVYVFFSKTDSREPRLAGGSYGGSVPFFGVDVDALKPGAAATIDAKTLGYPYESLSQLPAGEYYVQALMNVYTKFNRADGHVIWVHNDQWEGQQFNRSPGNLVSEVVRVKYDPKSRTPIALALTKKLPDVVVPADTRWVKHVKIKSELLSKFWGAPMYIGATVLLPKDFDTESTRRYPAIYNQGHFGLGAPFGFTDIVAADGRGLAAGGRAGGGAPGRAGGGAGGRGAGATASPFGNAPTSAREPGAQFAANWTSDDFPRFVAITWQHPTPYYDDSYAVNSVNNGPYQDALLTELVPLIEKQFRLSPRGQRALPHRRIHRRLGVRRAPDPAPRFLRRVMVPLSRPRGFPPQPARRQLRGHQRVHAQPERAADSRALHDAHA